MTNPRLNWVCPFCKAGQERERDSGLVSPDRVCGFRPVDHRFVPGNRGCGSLEALKRVMMQKGVVLGEEPMRLYWIRLRQGFLVVGWPSSWRERDPIRVLLKTESDTPTPAGYEDVELILDEAGVRA